MPNPYIDKVNINGSEYDIVDNTSGYITINDVPQEVFLVNITPTNQALTAGTSDKSATEIYNAVVAGKLPVANILIPLQDLALAAPLAVITLTTVDEEVTFVADFTYDDQVGQSLGVGCHATIRVIGNAVTVYHIPDHFITDVVDSLGYTPISGGSNAKSPVTISPKTSTIYQMSGAGSVTAGTKATFTQGTDSFTPASLSTGFYTAGSATTPAVINTSKFSGGSFTQGTDSFTKPTHAADSFTPASLQTGFYTVGSATTPASINTSKFSGGSYSHTGFSGGSFTRGAFSGGSLSMTMDTTDTKKLNITFTAATHANDSFTAATYGTDNFTAASLQTGFYTAGTKGTPTTIDTSKFNGGSFTQGAFTQGSFTQGTDSFTSAALQTGFYTAGTKGTPTTIDTSKFNGGSFTQGTDSFTQNTPTSVTLPTSSAVTVWTGYNTGVNNTFADAQTFTPTY